MTKPTEVIDIADPGDDVIRRFRFQIGYAALKAITLLDPTNPASCIYCEHHEDVLIALKSGQFIGTQVKTREVGLDPFKTTDLSIHGSLVRFCREDVAYPGQFAGFALVTNGAFFKGDGAEDLSNLIEVARANPKLKGVTRRHSSKQILDTIAAASGLALEQVTAALAKVQLEEMHTGLDLDAHVVQALSELDGCSTLRHVQLLKAAGLLRDRLWGASSKAHSLAQLQAHTPTLDIAARTTALTIANKRVDGATVTACLNDAAAASTPAQELLAIQDYLHRDGAPAVLSLMEAKMAAGDLTVMDVEQFKDDVRTLERSFLRWKEQRDLKEANDRLQHVQGLALQQCRAEHDATLAPPTFRNPIVRNPAALKSRLAAVAKVESASLFGCRPEHLSGAVGMLTDDCRVWWSAPFDLEGKP